MLIDRSESMKPAFQDVLTQSAALLKQIRDSLNPSQSISLDLIFFNHEVKKLSYNLQLTTKYSEIDDYFANVTACGATDLNVFLKEAIAQQGKSGVMLGFTDGIHEHRKPPANWPDLNQEFLNFRASATQANLLESFVFPVGNNCDDFLRKFADASGGKAQKVNTINDMFEAIHCRLHEILIGTELFRLVCDGQTIRWHVQQKPGVYSHHQILRTTDTVQQANLNNVSLTHTSWTFSSGINRLGAMALTPITTFTHSVGDLLRTAYGLFFSSPPSN